MTELVLFTTVGCHLCEQAESMLQLLGQQQSFILVKTDIADQPELMERYGIRIPVVRNEIKGEEIGWPFDQQQLLSLF